MRKGAALPYSTENVSLLGRRKPAIFSMSLIIRPLMLISSWEFEWRLWGRQGRRVLTKTLPSISLSKLLSFWYPFDVKHNTMVVWIVNIISSHMTTSDCCNGDFKVDYTDHAVSPL